VTDAASDAPKDVGTDAAADAASDAGGDGGISCTIPSTAGLTAESVTFVGQPFPTGGATGGTLVSGTYWETHADVYLDASAPTNPKELIVVDANNMTITEAQPEPDGGLSSLVSTYATSGSMLTLTAVSACGYSGSKLTQYSVSSGGDSSMPTEIIVYDVGSGRVSTFTLQ
jgi:hypothetical protein